METEAISKTVLIERDGPIVTVVLNRPEKLNAINKATWIALGDAIDELETDDDVRCIVLRGAGDKAFSPGADISEFETERANRDKARAYNSTVENTIDALGNCRHPTLALIKGICIGGGLEAAAFCDMRICGQSSRFGVPIKRLGLVMAYTELRGLISLVGRSKTLEILLEGRIFGADEAFRMGLVNRVVADNEVEAECYATAQRIAEGAPLTARFHKQALRRLAEPAPLSKEEIEAALDCYDSEDFRIGYRAFLDKISPEFKGS
ncbi:MAG: Short-chain-enoyl-CoA hydratase [Deltaproteobacteria bacterium]|nr:Short-chain-enoyl-CoA hydratase [Deltaproteobacteria bacterium]